MRGWPAEIRWRPDYGVGGLTGAEGVCSGELQLEVVDRKAAEVDTRLQYVTATHQRDHILKLECAFDRIKRLRIAELGVAGL